MKAARYTMGAVVAVILTLVPTAVLAASDSPILKFDFGPGEVAPGYTQVLPEMVYKADRGFGFEAGVKVTATDRGGSDPLTGDFCTSDGPFFFSVKLPEGNYNVTVTMGDAAGDTTNTIKAELRRLMVENARTKRGEFARRTFTVNVRTPQIAGGGQVRLKDREKTDEMAAWDGKLTLEFNGARPCVCAVEITPVADAVTVYLLGDSTVCDQPSEPWASWGQMLPRFFKPGVATANHAESGESVKSSLGARRFDKVFGAMKTGDYLFMQFGHNDQKEPGTNLAFTSYKADLKWCIAETRKRGGIPVLVTSTERKAGIENTTLGNYPEAVRELAREEKVALVDLNAMSKTFYKAMGPDIGKAFVDGTHHNNYGSYELARCVVVGIRSNGLDLVKFLADDALPFDPAHPDSVGTFNLPPSPRTTTQSPLGN